MLHRALSAIPSGRLANPLRTALRAMSGLALCSALAAADGVTLNGVTEQGRLQAVISGIPVALELARIEWPADATQRKTAVEALRSLASGRASVDHDAAFGLSDTGAGRVRVSVAGGKDLSEQLVLKGLVKASPGNDTMARLLAVAQSKAQQAKAGIWAAPTTTTTTTTATATTTTTTTTPAGASGTPVFSELGSKYYYPKGHRAIASVSSQRLTEYASAAAAEKAGKQAAPTEVALPAGKDKATAASLVEQARGLFRQAMEGGVGSQRDALLTQAFPIASRAVEIYNALAEASPNDEALLETASEASRLRHGIMKSRRN